MRWLSPVAAWSKIDRHCSRFTKVKSVDSYITWADLNLPPGGMVKFFQGLLIQVLESFLLQAPTL